MEYTIEYFMYNGKQQDVLFNCGKEHVIVSSFLLGECNLLQYFIENFNEVLSGKVKEMESSGDSCSLEINKDTTRIEFFFANEGEVDFEIVNTKELKEITEEYYKKRNEFFANKERNK